MTADERDGRDGLDVEASMIKGLEEALAFAQGTGTARTRLVERTVRRARVAPPPAYDAARVRRVRDRLALSQPVFAAALNVSPQTVKAWEQGARLPAGPTLRLLELAEEHPATFLTKVQVSTPGTPTGGKSEQPRS